MTPVQWDAFIEVVVTGYVDRLGEISDGTVRLVVPEGGRANYSVRELPLSGIAKAVVQVEFSPPNQREMQLASQTGKGAGT